MDSLQKKNPAQGRVKKNIKDIAVYHQFSDGILSHFVWP